MLFQIPLNTSHHNNHNLRLTPPAPIDLEFRLLTSNRTEHRTFFAPKIPSEATVAPQTPCLGKVRLIVPDADISACADLSCSLRRSEVSSSLFGDCKGSASLMIQNSLVGTGNVDKAAIFNSEGNSVWAASPGFTVRHQRLL